MKAFKAKILDAIAKLEKDLAQKAGFVKAAETARMEDIASRSAAIKDVYESLATKINVLKNTNRHGDLYIAVAEMREKLIEQEGKLDSIKTDSKTSLLSFDANNELAESLNSPFGLGKIQNKSIIEKLDFVTDISTKCTDETNDGFITCSVLMPENKLVVTDSNNKKVKVIDIRNQKVISDLKLTDRPWSVAKITDSSMVVTLPNSAKLVFVKITPLLSIGIDRELAVNGKCHGVAHHQGKLVVTFNEPCKLEVMNMQGTIVMQLDGCIGGKQLLLELAFVTVSTKNDLIYISNAGLHNVVCLKFDGSVVSTYKDSELEQPKHTVVDSYGMMYVCARGTASVHQLTPDCKKVKVLLTKADGLTASYSISYGEKEGKLYIVQHGSYNVKVYKMRYLTV